MPQDVERLLPQWLATYVVQAEATRNQRNAPTRWAALLEEFLACHRRDVNVGLHLITTPIALVASFALLRSYSPILELAAVAIYAATLAIWTPFGIWLITAGSLAGLLGLVEMLNPSVGLSIFLFVVAYVAQEVAHYIAGEHTLQSTYMQSRWWPIRLAEHTFFLLPLVLASAWRPGAGPLRLLTARNRVFSSRLVSESDVAEMRRIIDFVEAENPPLSRTAHWWRDELSEETKRSFDRLSQATPIREMFRSAMGDHYSVDVVDAMNEIYVTGPPQDLTSDTVFYTSHLDGPFAVYPFATVFRLMLAASPNDRVRTHFPMCDKTSAEAFTLTNGDAVAFDFNREPHYITSRTGDSAMGRRINLKIHYVAYPKGLGVYGRFLGKLTGWYDVRARQLFLATIQPKTSMARWIVGRMLDVTWIFEWLEKKVGLNNLAYVAVLGALSLFFRNAALFVLGTSFIHYLMYIATLAHPQDVCFGRFLRNVAFYKSLALSQLAFLGLYYFEPNPLAMGMIVGGFSLAGIAFAKLGVERTYFGVELGRCEPEPVKSFPYNCVPHPMIVGAMIGLIGFDLLTGLRQAFPWLIPTHIAFYLIHLLQEIVIGQKKIVDSNRVAS